MNITGNVIGRHVPYIASWSSETEAPKPKVIPRSRGIGFADETMTDRDTRGILWARTPSTPGHGKPMFAAVHSLRQRRAMRRLLCQVCGGPADRNANGVLWMLRDFRADWPDWPAGMGVTEPPICRACAEHSARVCPALRRGYALVRVADCTVIGVHGITYNPRHSEKSEAGIREFTDYRLPWTVAYTLVRELRDTTIEEPGA
ncbi:hypothetical protein [Actinokineospora enzanensis]|uniref:hypothetical protein n=1 Tax=Actinokineospora enzanensis TaxID=155975 RepID=UPI000A0620D7|nr:hypothetical protein [Actinokineospora enzanensis]